VKWNGTGETAGFRKLTLHEKRCPVREWGLKYWGRRAGLIKKKKKGEKKLGCGIGNTASGEGEAFL